MWHTGSLLPLPPPTSPPPAAAAAAAAAVGGKKGINGGGKWRACWIKYSITGVGPGLDVRMKQAEETKERNHRGYKKKKEKPFILTVAMEG